MKATVLRGMTWDHRRAIDPLLGAAALFSARHPGVTVEWSSRPLSGFEFTPVDELAAAYDLIILDHPFMGEVAHSKSLVPLDDVIGTAGNCFAGPSLETYRMNGALWAVPVDAACQVSVSRPDLLRRLDAQAPANWAELLTLGRKAAGRGLRLAIALKGVHSLMTFFTLMANSGKPCAVRRGQQFADPAAARAVLAALRALLRHCAAGVFDWNSIDLHDMMAGRDDLVFCPAVYCYATYAEADQANPLRFHDFCGPQGSGGSAIGGTGLGVSARSRHLPEALAYARFAAGLPAQQAFALHHGQPARREIWQDEEVNQRFGGCYRDTRATLDASWTRPRHRGYLKFQAEAGALIEAHLRGGLAEEKLLADLEERYAASWISADAA